MNDNKNVQIEVSDGAAIPDYSDHRLVTAWSISFFIAVTSLVGLCLWRPDPYWDVLKFLPDGIWVTFKLTVLGIAFAIPIGLITGLGRLSSNRIINLIASTYIEIIRGVPLLVQLVYIYYALAKVVRVPDTVAAVIALSICYGAYMGEVFRAGISSISNGQKEASRSLGFNPLQTMFYVILPQAWRTILPPVGNEFIALVKDTSLVSIIAMTNILQRGQEYTSVHFVTFETYTVVALTYLIITLILSKAVSVMEEKLNYYDKR